MIDIGELDDHERGALARVSGIDELRVVDRIDLVERARSIDGGDVNLFALDGATPFDSADEVVAAVNRYLSIGMQHGRVQFPVGVGRQPDVDASYLLETHRAKNHYFFFGDKDFLPSRDLPETFGDIADVDAPGVSYYQETNERLDAVSTFLSDRAGLVALDASIAYNHAAVAVEACQNSLHVAVSPELEATIDSGVTDAGGRKVTFYDFKALGQEMVCNSFGVAQSAKRSGHSYERYQATIAGVKFDLYENLTLHLLDVGEAMYDQL